MVAEALAQGLRFAEAGLLPPSEDALWLEPLIGRWATLVLQVCGIEPPQWEEHDRVSLEPADVDGAREWSGSNDAVWGDPSRPAAEPERSHASLPDEEWIWDLQQAVVEGAFHLSDLRDALRQALGNDDDLARGEDLDLDYQPVQLMQSTRTWYEALRPSHWECAPGVYLPPAVEALSVYWLGTAVFEIGRRTGVCVLADQHVAFEAARRALLCITAERVVDPDQFYPWGEANDSLTDEDFADWPSD